MKKYILLIMFLLMFSTRTDAKTIVSHTAVYGDNDSAPTTISVGSGETVWTKSIDISQLELVSLKITAVDNDGAAINTTVYIEFSNTKLTSAQECLTNSNYVVPETDGTVGTVTDLNTGHIFNLADKGLTYCRFKFIESGNGADFNAEYNAKQEY